MQKIQTFLRNHPVGIGSALFTGLLRIIQAINFAPVGALAVYSGARISGIGAFIVPIAVLILTDWILGFTRYGVGTWTVTTLFVYGAFLINILAGRLLKKTENAGAIVGLSVAGSIQFFLTTNLGVWLTSGMYSLDLAGLTTCFVAAIPFYRLTFVSDILFTCVLFLAHHFLAQRFSPAESIARA
ncbi:MAG: hypothetical protein K8S54_20075 [Spirochaetia bacterium]|nr:hypothetical protein [Spirochaetia bacterium]